MKPLIIGEAPSKNQQLEQPIEGRIGLRLASMAGLTLPEFLYHFDRVNLLHHRQDTAAHEFQFDIEAAKGEAAALKTTFKSDQIVILLGLRVADAFYAHHDYFVQQMIGGADVRVVPHPSGINRWWNDPANVQLAMVFMKNIVERTR